MHLHNSLITHLHAKLMHSFTCKLFEFAEVFTSKSNIFYAETCNLEKSTVRFVVCHKSLSRQHTHSLFQKLFNTFSRISRFRRTILKVTLTFEKAKMYVMS